ncbi:MAG: hypothetical protein ACK5NN_09650 [Sphingomonadaceae bacterium]
MSPFVPRSYEKRNHSIAVLCKIPLTRSFVKNRIAAIADLSGYGTQQRFVQTWGDSSPVVVRGWSGKEQRTHIISIVRDMDDVSNYNAHGQAELLFTGGQSFAGNLL